MARRKRAEGGVCLIYVVCGRVQRKKKKKKRRKKEEKKKN